MVCGRHHNFMHLDSFAATSKHFVTDRSGASAESQRSSPQCHKIAANFNAVAK